MDDEIIAVVVQAIELLDDNGDIDHARDRGEFTDDEERLYRDAILALRDLRDSLLRRK